MWNIFELNNAKDFDGVLQEAAVLHPPQVCRHVTHRDENPGEEHLWHKYQRSHGARLARLPHCAADRQRHGDGAHGQQDNRPEQRQEVAIQAHDHVAEAQGEERLHEDQGHLDDHLREVVGEHAVGAAAVLPEEHGPLQREGQDHGLAGAEHGHEAHLHHGLVVVLQLLLQLLPQAGGLGHDGPEEEPPEAAQGPAAQPGPVPGPQPGLQLQQHRVLPDAHEDDGEEEREQGGEEEAHLQGGAVPQEVPPLALREASHLQRKGLPQLGGVKLPDAVAVDAGPEAAVAAEPALVA
mmetsp:Transcript_111576/g.315578  ORF Transcript_111576/g.315578 Transcript_111576/m.315578 type:complete len:294 (+) Transcript_111576:144-1025(+)